MARADAEEAISFALLNAQAEATGVGVIVVDASDAIVFANERFRSLWCAPIEALTSRAALAAWLVGCESERARAVATFLRWTEPSAGEVVLPNAQVIGARVREVGNTGALLWVFRDLTARRQLEAALRDAGSLLRMLDPHTEGVVFELDREARIVATFPSGGHAFAHEDAEFPDRKLSDVLGEVAAADCDRVVREVFRTRREGHFEFELDVGEEERLFVADVVHLPTKEDEAPRVTVMIRDVTDRHRAQVELLEAERLASVATLAAGVAREINNPLAYTLLNLQRIQNGIRALASEATSESVATLGSAIDIGLEGARRVQSIVVDLLYFSRNDRAETATAVDVRRALEFAVGMTSHEICERARIVRDYRDVPLVVASETRLSQVFLNLIANAAQAIEEGGPDRNEIRLVTRTDANGCAVVEIHDTGVGMTPQLSARIFDPFYTTKPGVGTGLGLTLCRGIATLLGGRLAVESEVGRGSVFRLVLPAAVGEEITRA